MVTEVGKKKIDWNGNIPYSFPDKNMKHIKLLITLIFLTTIGSLRAEDTVAVFFPQPTRPTKAEVQKPVIVKRVYTVSEKADIELLKSIAQVEGAKLGKVGKYGERGPFQFLKIVWKKHSKMPFTFASESSEDAYIENVNVGLAHIKWIRTQIENPTEYRVALAWNAGVGAVNRGTFKNRSYNYAVRVMNIHLEGKKLAKL